MVFEYSSDGQIGMLTAFAAFTKGTVSGNMLTLPPQFGKGYVIGLNLSPEIRMMVQQYELQEELVFRRLVTKERRDAITITFHNAIHTYSDVKVLPSVQVTSADLQFEHVFPAHTEINTIVIRVSIRLLKDLLNKQQGNALLQSIINGNQPYLYEEIISPEIREVASKIVTANAKEELYDFYCRLKAEELIYLFLAELQQRQHTAIYPLNNSDVKMMYAIRDAIIKDLSVTPDLTELARLSGMSESKMQRLFRQIFGNSIYNYYQALRMHEAAYLIREKQLSVSEAGYRLGFSNLSHFTRLFEKHIGYKPKKYSLSQ
jgi:AraC-like DNA-binding protein